YNNKNNLNGILNGSMGLGAIRGSAMNVTLDPKLNMQYQFDKQSVINSLGQDTNAVVYEALNQQFTNKNPWGRSLQGRAKWAMNYGLTDNMEEAMMFAQGWMNHNPQYN